MRVLYLAQELAPYFVEGGLGLTAAELPAALHEYAGIDYTLMVPYYPWLVRKAGLRTEVLAELPPVTIGGLAAGASIHRVIGDRVIDHGGSSELLLVRSDAWYDKADEGIYRDRAYVEYVDAVPRAAFFGSCAARWQAAHPGRFSLVHGNDWQSGMALFRIAQARGEATAPGLLYDIHNGEYQGIVPPGDLERLGLAEAELANARAASAGQPGLMLLGLHAADVLATCSPTYARELETALAGTPMAELLRRKGVTGIISGIDAAKWDPAHPEAPSLRYTAATVREGKLQNKRDLQTRCGLAVDADVPVYGICARLVPEKGIDLVIEGLADLVRSGRIQIVVVGVGERRYREAFQRLHAERPTALYDHPEFDLALARLLYAGCDFTLMPSLVEPCGLNQLISMHYGTLPIVSPVGGLNDTVTDVRRHPGEGTGLVLKSLHAEGLRETVESSISWLRGDPGAVHAARLRAMAHDWSWRRVAQDYAALYAAVERAAAHSALRAAE